jgi:hypothetical protein
MGNFFQIEAVTRKRCLPIERRVRSKRALRQPPPHDGRSCQ